jgi:hypothetical protein
MALVKRDKSAAKLAGFLWDNPKGVGASYREAIDTGLKPALQAFDAWRKKTTPTLAGLAGSLMGLSLNGGIGGLGSVLEYSKVNDTSPDIQNAQYDFALRSIIKDKNAGIDLYISSPKDRNRLIRVNP